MSLKLCLRKATASSPVAFRLLLNHHRQCYNSLAGGNPMFPQRQLAHEAPPLIDPILDPKNSDKNKKLEDDDNSILAKHGGKISLIALMLSIGLIYSYIKNGQNQRDEEKRLAHEAAVEPDEINDVRYNNNTITSDIYTKIVRVCREKYGDATVVNYRGFIRLVQEILRTNGVKEVQYGHLLDRVVFRHTKKCDDDTDVDLEFLLVLMNMTVNASADERIDGLYSILNSASDAREDGGCKYDRVVAMIKYLCDSCQVPSDKRTIETGQKFPYRTYREKLPAEMVDSYETQLLHSENDSSMFSMFIPAKKYERNVNKVYSEDEFKTMLASKYVCVWNVCHR